MQCIYLGEGKVEERKLKDLTTSERQSAVDKSIEICKDHKTTSPPTPCLLAIYAGTLELIVAGRIILSLDTSSVAFCSSGSKKLLKACFAFVRTKGDLGFICDVFECKSESEV